MKKIILITIFLIMTSPINAQSLWNNRSSYLFSDRSAKKIGDIITVKIAEQSSAYQKADTKTENESNISVGPGTGFFSFGDDPSATNGFKESGDFEGTGSTARSGELKGTITVSIVKVHENGDYSIEGSKELMINSEKQNIYIAGNIRPEDIDQNNAITSDLISNATIHFSGSGAINDTQEPGILAKVFAWIF